MLISSDSDSIDPIDPIDHCCLHPASDQNFRRHLPQRVEARAGRRTFFRWSALGHWGCIPSGALPQQKPPLRALDEGALTACQA